MICFQMFSIAPFTIHILGKTSIDALNFTSCVIAEAKSYRQFIENDQEPILV